MRIQYSFRITAASAITSVTTAIASITCITTTLTSITAQHHQQQRQFRRAAPFSDSHSARRRAVLPIPHPSTRMHAFLTFLPTHTRDTTMSSSSSRVMPDWLAKQSTTGTSRITLPPLPEDGYDLGFPLPNAPTTAQGAIALVQALRSDSGLPDSTHYNEKFNGLRQNRLIQAIMKLLLQCLDVWAADPANAAVAEYVNTADKRIRRRHQLSPLVVGFKNAATRNQSYRSWEEGLHPATAAEPETLDALVYEKAASGTIEECMAGHRVNSANLYLVSTKDHPSLGQSFAVHRLQLLGSEGIRKASELLRDEEKRAQHMNRGGTDHDVAVLITAGSDTVYIYDPDFDQRDWPRPKRFSEALMIGRVRQLLENLKGGKSPKDRALKKTKIIIGGGGNEGDSCRAMAVRWMVEVIAQQWMGLDGQEAAQGPPLYFGEGCDQQEVHW